MLNPRLHAAPRTSCRSWGGVVAMALLVAGTGVAQPAHAQVRAPAPYAQIDLEVLQSALAPPTFDPDLLGTPSSLHPRISQTLWGAGSYMGGLLVTLLIVGPLRASCLLSDGPGTDWCTDVILVSAVGAGLAASLTVGSLRQEAPHDFGGNAGLILGTVGGFALAHALGATRDGNRVVSVALPLQVGGALLGEWVWEARRR